jgi:hypothetical protein
MKTSSKNLLLFTAIFYSVCALAQNGSELALNTQTTAPSPAKNMTGVSVQQEELASKKQKSVNNNIRALAIAKAEIRASQARAIVNHKDSTLPLIKNEPEKPATKTTKVSSASKSKTKPAPEKSRKPEVKKKEVKKSKSLKAKPKKTSPKKTGHKKAKAPGKQKNKKKKKD